MAETLTLEGVLRRHIAIPALHWGRIRGWACRCGLWVGGPLEHHADHQADAVQAWILEQRDAMIFVADQAFVNPRVEVTSTADRVLSTVDAVLSTLTKADQ